MRATCCLNLPPPTSNSPTSNTCVPIRPHPQLPLAKNEERCWRSQSILMKMACTLIGLQLGNLVTAVQHQEVGHALPLPVPPVTASQNPKWSEKRTCPSWLHNSLETVVPENLPRPAARRRYEAVRSSISKTAPPLPLSVQIQSDCFSL